MEIMQKSKKRMMPWCMGLEIHTHERYIHVYAKPIIRLRKIFTLPFSKNGFGKQRL
jgi:hypothetical protein